MKDLDGVWNGAWRVPIQQVPDPTGFEGLTLNHSVGGEQGLRALHGTAKVMQKVHEAWAPRGGVPGGGMWKMPGDRAGSSRSAQMGELATYVAAPVTRRP